MLLAAKGLDLAHALQVIHQERVHGAGGFALGAIAAVRGERVPQRSACENGQGDHRHGRQHRVRREHNDQHPKDAQHANTPLLCSVNQHALNGVDVLNHTRHQVARRALVEIVDRQALEARIDVPAHVVDDVLLEGIIDTDTEAVEQVPQKECAEQGQYHPGELVGLLLNDDLVNDLLSEFWVRQRKGH